MGIQRQQWVPTLYYTLPLSRKVNTSRVSLPCHKNTKSNSPERKDQEVTPRKCADCTHNYSHYTTCNYLGKPKLESPKNSRHKERPKFFIPYQSRGKKSENFCPTAVERREAFLCHRVLTHAQAGSLLDVQLLIKTSHHHPSSRKLYLHPVVILFSQQVIMKFLKAEWEREKGWEVKDFWEGTSSTRCEQHLPPMIFKE